MRVLEVEGVERLFPGSTASALRAAVADLAGKPAAAEVGIDADGSTVTVVVGLDASAALGTAEKVRDAVRDGIERARPGWQPKIVVTVSSIGSE